MKLKQLINDNEFKNARLIIYSILFITYIYLAYFSNFKCKGCFLCGMTRATKKLLILDFKTAFEFNKNVCIVAIMILIIVIDILVIFINFIKKYINGGK